MILKLYEENTNQKHVRQVVDILEVGGIVVYPTDTIYGIGCTISSMRAIENVARIKGKKVEEANFSFIFSDLSQLSDFTKPISSDVFRLLKNNLPGPFTFILEATSNVPKIFKNKKRTIGVRVPQNKIIRAIVAELGNPMITTSVRDEDDVIEYTTDPELIHEKFKDQVDLVVDGGFGNNVASTIVDCTVSPPQIIRQGIGEIV